MISPIDGLLSMFPSWGNLLAIFVDVLLGLKLYALTYHTVWIVRNRKRYTSDVADCLVLMEQIEDKPPLEAAFDSLAKKYEVLLSHKNWPVNRAFNYAIRGTVSKLDTTVTGIVFGLPFLILLACVVFSVCTIGWLVYTEASLLLLCLWVSFLQTILSRLLTGYCDTLLRQVTLRLGDINLADLRCSYTEVILATIKIYVGMTFAFIIGYAGIYFGLARISDFHALTGVKTYFDALCFSVAIKATQGLQGFGNSVPQSVVVKFFVASQTLLGLFMMNFLVASLFGTADRDRMISDRRDELRWEAIDSASRSGRLDTPDTPHDIPPTILSPAAKLPLCSVCKHHGTKDPSGICSRCRPKKSISAPTM